MGASGLHFFVGPFSSMLYLSHCCFGLNFVKKASIIVADPSDPNFERISFCRSCLLPIKLQYFLLFHQKELEAREYCCKIFEKIKYSYNFRNRNSSCLNILQLVVMFRPIYKIGVHNQPS